MYQSEKKYSMIFLCLIGLISYGINVLLNIIISGKLSQSGYGLYALARQSFALVSVLLLLGTDKATRSFLTDYLALNDSDSIKRFIRWNIQIAKRSISVLLVVFGMLILLDIFTHLDSSEEFRKIHIVIAYLAFTPFGCLKNLFTNYLLSVDYINTYTVVNNISEVLLTILLFEGYYLIARRYPNDEGLLVLTLTANLMIIFSEFMVLGFDKRREHSFKKLVKKAITERSLQPLHVPTEWLSTGLFLTVSNLLRALVASINMFIAKIFCGSAGLATYAVVLVIASILPVVTNNCYKTLIPLIRHQYRSEERKYLQLVVTRSQLVAMGVMIATILVVLPLSPIIFSHFGSGYAGTASNITLCTLMASYAVQSLGYPAACLLEYSGYERQVLGYKLVQFFLTVASCIGFTVKLGIVGVAIGLFIANLIFLFVAVIMCKRLTGFRSLLFI